MTQIGIMKKRPAVPPTGTQSDMAFGTLTAGSETSSAMEETVLEISLYSITKCNDYWIPGSTFERNSLAHDLDQLMSEDFRRLTHANGGERIGRRK